MQTKSFADLTVTASAQRDEAAQTSASAPVELDQNQLQFVSGGLTPRGGWDSATTLDTSDTPRGGWL